jgi:hypothetical protein
MAPVSQKRDPLRDKGRNCKRRSTLWQDESNSGVSLRYFAVHEPSLDVTVVRTPLGVAAIDLALESKEYGPRQWLAGRLGRDGYLVERSPEAG